MTPHTIARPDLWRSTAAAARESLSAEQGHTRREREGRRDSRGPHHIAPRAVIALAAPVASRIRAQSSGNTTSPLAMTGTDTALTTSAIRGQWAGSRGRWATYLETRGESGADPSKYPRHSEEMRTLGRAAAGVRRRGWRW